MQNEKLKLLVNTKQLTRNNMKIFRKELEKLQNSYT